MARSMKMWGGSFEPYKWFNVYLEHTNDLWGYVREQGLLWWYGSIHVYIKQTYLAHLYWISYKPISLLNEQWGMVVLFSLTSTITNWFIYSATILYFHDSQIIVLLYSHFFDINYHRIVILFIQLDDCCSLQKQMFNS